MAVRDYKPIGDFSKRQSFHSKRDRMIINHPRAIELIKKKFGATDFEFDFYFVNTKEAKDHSEIGEVKPQWVRDNLGDDVYNEVMKNTDDDSIKVIFTNNSADKHRPMTAWIMAHRIGHALARGGSSASYHYKETSNHIISNLSSILEFYGIQNFPSSDNGMSGFRTDSESTRKNQLTMLNFFYHIATFKSARDKNIRDWFEILNELIAQYLTTGKIKFNPPPAEFKVQTKNGRATYTFKQGENMGELKQMIEGLARDIEYMIEGVLHTTHNSIFVM
jgi:hypothetical protein